MSFGMWLLAFFCSPVYFLIRKRWGAFIFNSIFYGMALILLLTMILAFIAPFFWIIGVVHAMWDLSSTLREKAMHRQAELIAQKMAAEKK